ncbi:MAG TPA: efflux RND transporter periplasmic adaptor subunit [Polyangiaceae bacterium]|jgi:RND family efflux transporter MFP subunit
MKRFPIAVAAGVAVVVAIGAGLVVHAESKTNKIALAPLPKRVSFVVAKSATYRPSRTYVGTIRPWVSASIGPQFVAAYVDTVLVRPGAVVKRNEVLGTLDCKSANAATQAIASQARAIDARQKAIADEAARKRGLLDGGFIAENDVVQAMARSEAEAAQLASERASLTQSSLQVNDCVLRAPFDGEIGARFVDPGGFARPGSAVVTVVDRSTVRVTIDVPENDFEWLAPGTKTKIHVIANGKDIEANVARRAPSADPGTRTVHVEIDVVDAERTLPVNTTAEVHVDIGQPVVATEIPVASATVQNDKAVIFTVDGDVAHVHAVALLGEIGGGFFVAPSELAPGAKVVTEGRSVLADGDRVSTR